MSFDEAIKNLHTFLENDAKDIINLLSNYQKQPITAKTSIKLNAFDVVVPFTYDPVSGTQANKDLNGRKGNYIFVMTKQYNVPDNFNNVYSGAPLNDSSLTVINNGDVLYLGTAKSILTRMHAHFDKDREENSTGSLKLGSDERKGIQGYFTVYAFCIKKKYNKYYPIIGPFVEKYLHENINVLMGNK